MLPYLNQVQAREKTEEQLKKRLLEAKEEKYDFTSLVTAINTNTDVEVELEAFRKHFGPRIIKPSERFNPEPLLDAMQVYINNYDPWSSEQCSLFWRQVIGYLQRMLPACYAQAFCQGLYNVTDGNEPLKRSLKLADGTSFYPVDPSSRAEVGFDFGVYSYLLATGRCGVDGRSPGRAGARCAQRDFSKLMSSKNVSIAKLMQQPENQAKRQCVIL